MSTNIQNALLIFLVGMVTVFAVLCIVVLTGKVLIYLVNKYGPVSSKNKIKNRDFNPLFPDANNQKAMVSKKKLAAIISTVDIVTLGKGNIINIEKITSES